jgi:signal transduction histidine kinase
MWFGLAILLAGGASWIVAFAFGGGSHWRTMYEGVCRFGAKRFADVWEDPSARQRLMEDLEKDLNLQVTLRDRDGNVIDTGGRGCDDPDVKLTPEREGVVLGRIDLCLHRRGPKPVPAILGLIAALSVLWIVSHKIAKKMGSPLVSLAKVATDIGHGHYDVKVRVPKHSPIEVANLADAVRDMASKIKRQMGDQRELLASVSHEIRSPLARIRLLLELTRDEDRPPAEREKLLADLEQEIEEIDDLVGGLLANSRVDFSALTLRPLDIVEAAARALDRAGLPVVARVTGKPREVRCDATLLSRALGNLLDNAKSHGGGAKGLSVRFDADRVTLEVEDAGNGFVDGDHEKVFDPFYRRPTGAHDGHGLGLGLALVKRIANAHGGDAYAKNGDRGGAVVGIWLPIRDEADGIPSSAG